MSDQNNTKRLVPLILVAVAAAVGATMFLKKGPAESAVTENVPVQTQPATPTTAPALAPSDVKPADPAPAVTTGDVKPAEVKPADAAPVTTSEAKPTDAAPATK